MLATGDFCDPGTRLPFSDEDLAGIDAVCVAAGLTRPGGHTLVQARHAPQLYSESRFRRDALLGLERCAGEVVTDMLRTIECTPDPGQLCCD
jgi:hypothetical protein